ncbi:unnamed protein product, partial [Ectocarpus sp. 12 AP-2014]
EGGRPRKGRSSAGASLGTSPKRCGRRFYHLGDRRCHTRWANLHRKKCNGANMVVSVVYDTRNLPPLAHVIPIDDDVVHSRVGVSEGCRE